WVKALGKVGDAEGVWREWETWRARVKKGVEGGDVEAQDAARTEAGAEGEVEDRVRAAADGATLEPTASEREAPTTAATRAALLSSPPPTSQLDTSSLPAFSPGAKKLKSHEPPLLRTTQTFIFALLRANAPRLAWLHLSQSGLLFTNLPHGVKNRLVQHPADAPAWTAEMQDALLDLLDWRLKTIEGRLGVTWMRDGTGDGAGYHRVVEGFNLEGREWLEEALEKLAEGRSGGRLDGEERGEGKELEGEKYRNEGKSIAL
ncbi:hypothetical protein AOQ84DRAFT_402895, partial [Glonium stellatum]